MQLRISDPTEGSAWRGYWSLEVLVEGDLLVEANVASTALEGAGPESLEDLATTLRELADMYEQLDDVDGVSL
jgi:hypothetical protein